MFWYNYFMDDVFAHLVFYILFKKIGEMIDSVVLISQGPILFHHTAPNVIKKMGKKIPETLYFSRFPAIEATGFVLRSGRR